MKRLKTTLSIGSPSGPGNSRNSRNWQRSSRGKSWAPGTATILWRTGAKEADVRRGDSKTPGATSLHIPRARVMSTSRSLNGRASAFPATSFLFTTPPPGRHVSRSLHPTSRYPRSNFDSSRRVGSGRRVTRSRGEPTSRRPGR